MRHCILVIVTFSILILTACSSKQNYREIYVEECDYVYKEVVSEKVRPDLTRCSSGECILSGAFIFSTVGALATLDEQVTQQKYFDELKAACHEKGVAITEKPSEKRIYLNKRPSKQNKTDNDSELGDIERQTNFN